MMEAEALIGEPGDYIGGRVRGSIIGDQKLYLPCWKFRKLRCEGGKKLREKAGSIPCWDSDRK